jgi:hypothetical protein
MHCRLCKEGMPYNPQVVLKACPNCGSKEPFVTTVGSIHEGAEEQGGAGKTVLFVLAGSLLLEGLVYLGVVRVRKLRWEAAAAWNRRLVCHCPYCKLRIRYPAARANTGIVCSGCRTAFLLPARAKGHAENTA